MRPFLILLAAFATAAAWGSEQSAAVAKAGQPADTSLEVGFGEADITPKLDGKPVFMAGFGQNRKATGVSDPLKARAMVLKHRQDKIALASIDVVGLFHPEVVAVRKKLTGFRYVLVSSTHNHEGPDTLGLWGPNPFTSGIDPAYIDFLEKQIVLAVESAERSSRHVYAKLGSASAPELLHDGREPYVKHDELVALHFVDSQTEKPAGLVVQWNCHPETLADKNTMLSADFVGATVAYLEKEHGCPVVYLTGTVGGLMTSLHVEVKDDAGRALADGTVEKTVRYGRLVGQLADRAIETSKAVRLIPFAARSREIFIPMDNPRYQVGRQLGVLKREAFLWEGTAGKARPSGSKDAQKRQCIQTEVGWLRLGELDMALIPGEIYPELVLGKVQDPPDPGADFPDAPIEPAIYQQLRGPYRMIIGLANDEIGYIIPKRQWDEKPPFCYKRTKPQYGETNSVGPDTAPIICNAFKDLVTGQK